MLIYGLRLRSSRGGVRVTEGLCDHSGRFLWSSFPGSLVIVVDSGQVENFAQLQEVSPQEVLDMLDLLRRRPEHWQHLARKAAEVGVVCDTLTGDMSLVFEPCDPEPAAAALLPLLLSRLLGRAAGLRVCDRCGTFFAPRRARHHCKWCRPAAIRRLPKRKYTALKEWQEQMRRHGVDFQSPEGKKLFRQAIADAHRLPVEDFLAQYAPDKKTVGCEREEGEDRACGAEAVASA
jgi:hypothetical protein